MNGNSPLRQATCEDCEIRVMTWHDVGGWRAAWRLERETTWRAVDEISATDEDAASTAIATAGRLIRSKGKPRVRRPRSAVPSRKVSPRVATPFKEPASEVWRGLHRRCQEAEAALAAARERPLPEGGPGPVQADLLQTLECEAYEARLKMELYMAAILQHKRRKNGAALAARAASL